MASEFAMKLVAKLNDYPAKRFTVIDAELAEVRDVLKSLAMRLDPKDESPCWCRDWNAAFRGHRDSRCQSARALAARLDTGKENPK